MKAVRNRAGEAWRRFKTSLSSAPKGSPKWMLLRLTIHYANLKWRAKRYLRPKVELGLRALRAIEAAGRRGLAKPVLIKLRGERFLRRRTGRPQERATGWHKSLAACFDMRHLEALCLLVEERCVRLDLLAQLLGVPVAEARRVVEVCIGLGLVKDERILVKERYAWVWATRAGAQAIGSDRPGWKAPRLGFLTHLEATLRVRVLLTGEKRPNPRLWRLRRSLRTAARVLVDGLSNRCGYVLVPKPLTSRLAERGLRWVAERELIRSTEDFSDGYVPDALLESGHERHALLILTTPWRKKRIADVLTDLRRSADSVCCFCFPPQIRRVQEIAEELSLTHIYILPMPEGAVAAQAGTSTARDMFARLRRYRPRPLFPLEPRQAKRLVEAAVKPSTRFDLIHFETLCLLENEEYIRADLLARLLGVPLCEAREAVDACVELGLAKQGRIFVYEDNPWAWLTNEGLRAVGSAKRPPSSPGLFRLEYLEARATVHAFLTEAPQRSRLAALGRTMGVKLVTWLADRAGYSLSWAPAAGVLQDENAHLVYGPKPAPRRFLKGAAHLADAFLEVEGKDIAVIVAPIAMRPQLTAEAFRELTRAADVVCCYCSPLARGEFEEVVERYGLFSVVVTDIPKLGDRG